MPVDRAPRVMHHFGCCSYSTQTFWPVFRCKFTLLHFFTKDYAFRKFIIKRIVVLTIGTHVRKESAGSAGFFTCIRITDIALPSQNIGIYWKNEPGIPRAGNFCQQLGIPRAGIFVKGVIPGAGMFVTGVAGTLGTILYENGSRYMSIKLYKVL